MANVLSLTAQDDPKSDCVRDCSEHYRRSTGMYCLERLIKHGEGIQRRIVLSHYETLLVSLFASILTMARTEIQASLSRILGGAPSSPHLPKLSEFLYGRTRQYWPLISQ
jgi:hypothetical protein